MSKWDLNHCLNLDRNAKNEVYFKIFSLIKTKRSFFGGQVKISCVVLVDTHASRYETEMTAIVSNNPIINLPTAISNAHGDGSSPSQRVIDLYSFPKELVEWIEANQSSSFERMQRKSMRQPIHSEGDAMQYWLSRATIEDTHGNYTYFPTKNIYIMQTITVGRFKYKAVLFF